MVTQTDDELTTIARRYAEYRSQQLQLSIVTAKSQQYYRDLLTAIQADQSFEAWHFSLLMDWFENAPQGQDAWLFGMSNMPKPGRYRHALERNIAGWMGWAIRWRKDYDKQQEWLNQYNADHKQQGGDQ